MDVAAELCGIIANYKSLDVAEVTPDKTFEELQIDSLDAIDIIYEIEDKYGIDIPTEDLDLQNTKTINDVLALVARHMADGDAGRLPEPPVE